MIGKYPQGEYNLKLKMLKTLGKSLFLISWRRMSVQMSVQTPQKYSYKTC